jgi:hypothetical protein
MPGPTLWHYTCQHGREALGDVGRLLPAHMLTDSIPPLWWPGRLVWLTDMRAPDVDALGLSSVLIVCNRAEHRYRVTDTRDCQHWLRARRPYRHEAGVLEVPGTRPAHWYVSGAPVPVVYDPIRPRWET